MNRKGYTVLLILFMEAIVIFSACTAQKAVEHNLVSREISMSYGADFKNTLDFSFDFPDTWTVQPDIYFITVYNGDRWAGQIEIQEKVPGEAVFGDTDRSWSDAVSRKDLVVSGYPARRYMIETYFEEESDEKNPQYLYYILADGLEDHYLLIFFDSDEENGVTEKLCEKIVLTFTLIGS